MAINKESNAYTIIFAIIMVVIVGGGLAALAMGLKPAQQANVLNEKKQNIIQATGFFDKKEDVTRDNAADYFGEFVKERIILDFEGKVVEKLTAEDEIDLKNTKDAFNVNMRKQYMNISDKEDRQYPLFVCENEGKTIYVISCSGKGLWDDVWGYVGYDLATDEIVAAKFDHKGETAGLGSIINEDPFQDQFVGKTLVNDQGEYQPIKVVKPGSQELTEHKVDGLSGATFTGKGVEEMMERNFAVYVKYFKSIK
ncbi:NADH:ubiquinone reductase (Na(+)-transporting) subunit C [Parvicella tangerina]|uniref:Na(+)-translocating NADH-quinone reductase subunit C n=1 Tax=Parvicella tangerina TaxID=2829795 RepID=A0A916JNT4_9FLAO|nr:NADH:ubiquinone reductase (Na(+)-transporting) subunit C [Parvicella tangerina]CAG5084075.1 Na(+)-translocating NADH-quinone reductase subunit C [Parvicella tangerina]